MMIRVLFIILFSEISHTVGQILFKKSANQLEEARPNNLRSYGAFIARVIRIPSIWLGFFWLGVGVVLWLMALAQSHLSIVYPVGSIQYLLTMTAARIFLGEKIDRAKLMGTFLVIAGIILILSPVGNG